MQAEYVFKLTAALYRVSDFMPEQEPLRAILRKTALDILGDAYKEKNNLQENIGIIQTYLRLAKEQNWLVRDNFIVLEQGYQRVKEQEAPATKINPVDSKMAAAPKLTNFVKQGLNLNSRQEKIIKLLKERGHLQVKDANGLLPGVTRRTILRDMNFLLANGVVKRMGEKNNTKYVLR